MYTFTAKAGIFFDNEKVKLYSLYQSKTLPETNVSLYLGAHSQSRPYGGYSFDLKPSGQGKARVSSVHKDFTLRGKKTLCFFSKKIQKHYQLSCSGGVHTSTCQTLLAVSIQRKTTLFKSKEKIMLSFLLTREYVCSPA